MKTYKQLIEDNIKWLVPDYPEQILSKDDPEGNWVTGDSPKPIDTFPEVDGKVRGIESTAAAIARANKMIKKERENAKPNSNKK
mgnify:FL=1|jgi:hypothetical protein